MSSRFRVEVLALAILTLAATSGCERERREFHSAPAEAAPPTPRQSTLQPGMPMAEVADPIGGHYERNAFHISEGERLYRWFNCNGCHANGGGGMGPALMDEEWRYGGRIDQIHSTIMEGRPNGMPSWRGKLTDVQAWQISAYVRAMSGNVRKDAAPSRSETLMGAPPPTQVPDQPPRGGDVPGVQAPGT